MKSLFHFALVWLASMVIDAAIVLFNTETKPAISIWHILGFFGFAVGGPVGLEIPLPATEKARMAGIIALVLIFSIALRLVINHTRYLKHRKEATALDPMRIGLVKSFVSTIACGGVCAPTHAIIASAAALLGTAVCSVCIYHPATIHFDELLHADDATKFQVVINIANQSIAFIFQVDRRPFCSCT